MKPSVIYTILRWITLGSRNHNTVPHLVPWHLPRPGPALVTRPSKKSSGSKHFGRFHAIPFLRCRHLHPESAHFISNWYPSFFRVLQWAYRMATSIIAPKRPFVTLPFLLPSWTDTLALGSRRCQSSYRRTKQRLRVKPDASFGPSQQGRDHIIHNPPSSAPSVYHTPNKFLPPNDARKTMRVHTAADYNAHNLPNVHKVEAERKYHLNPSDIDEIRKLRLADPMTWSRHKLAKRFECSPLFIAMVCEASAEKKQIQKQVLEAVQSRWGPKRRMAREDRQLRRAAWGRDE